MATNTQAKAAQLARFTTAELRAEIGRREAANIGKPLPENWAIHLSPAERDMANQAAFPDQLLPEAVADDEEDVYEWADRAARADAYASYSAMADKLYFNRIANFNSSNVEAFAYDVANSRLYLWFLPKGRRGTTRYCYDNVPRTKFDGMKAAGSKGKYLHREIKIAGYRYHGPF